LTGTDCVYHGAHYRATISNREKSAWGELVIRPHMPRLSKMKS